MKLEQPVHNVVDISDSEEEDNGSIGSGQKNLPPKGALPSQVPTGEALPTRSFWKAGDYAVKPTFKFDPAGDLLEHARVHPKFLHSNATSHKWAFGAIAELLDNAVDEIHHGATFVKVDKIDVMKDKSPALLFQDDGGGMDPEAIRKCMSLGYSSKKSNTTIGQYGNGFKTSTMRLGADVIVFSRATQASKATQSVGLLSYTFLRTTGQDDVIVPMIDFDISKNWVEPINYGSEADWCSNLNTILEWSPFSSKEELMEQFEDIGSHGTKVIIYNLWLNDEGVYELSFDDDEEDIQMRDEADSGVNRLSKKAIERQSHISYRIRFSLRAYASVLYLRKFENFKIIIRGKPVVQFYVVDLLKYTSVVNYKPQLGSNSNELTVETTLGFVKEAPALNVSGFNVYHKNRLIRPFWKVTAEGSAKGNGVVGVLEANFIEPAHEKQDFERSTLFVRLEIRLKQMVMEYWKHHAHLVGYKPDRGMLPMLLKGQHPVEDPEDIQMQSIGSLPESMLQQSLTGVAGLDGVPVPEVQITAQDIQLLAQIRALFAAGLAGVAAQGDPGAQGAAGVQAGGVPQPPPSGAPDTAEAGVLSTPEMSPQHGAANLAARSGHRRNRDRRSRERRHSRAEREPTIEISDGRTRDRSRNRKRSRSVRRHRHRSSSTSDSDSDSDSTSDLDSSSTEERVSRKARQGRHGGTSVPSLIERFQRMAPPRFSGKGGPEVAETWMTEIERLLDNLQHTSEDMVTLAVFCLNDLAYAWWKRIAGERRKRYRKKGRKDPGCSWKEFTAHFQDRWIGSATSDSRIAEFEALTQESLTVTEYEYRFEKLVQYVHYYDCREKVKTERFIRGLRPELGRYLVTHELSSFNKAVQKAQKIERMEQAGKAVSSQPQTGRKSQTDQGQGKKTGKSGRPDSFPNRGRGYAICGKRHSGECYMRTGWCLNCGSPDHWVKDCPTSVGRGSAVHPKFQPRGQYTHYKQTGWCLNCGSPDHWVKDCPTSVGRGSAVQPKFQPRGQYTHYKQNDSC